MHGAGLLLPNKLGIFKEIKTISEFIQSVSILDTICAFKGKLLLNDFSRKKAAYCKLIRKQNCSLQPGIHFLTQMYMGLCVSREVVLGEGLLSFGALI